MRVDPVRVDARCAVLCAWIFDAESGAPPPFGFELLTTFAPGGEGYLGALLRSADPDPALYLVSRGTRFDTRSPATIFRGLQQDLGAAGAILTGAKSIPTLSAALEAAALVQSRWRDGAAPLRLTGQSLGGGLAQIQGAACLAARQGDPGLRDVRCITMAAMDVSRILAERFTPEVGTALAARTVNHVSDRDGLTGPRGVFGHSIVGEQRLFRDMDGPRLGGALAFHRARAWVNHCAGRSVDAPDPPRPHTAEDWTALRVRGWLPEGWPRP